MITTYGTIGKKGTHIDTSKTLQGAKIHATKNGYNVVTKRTGYNAYVVAKKINGQWLNLKTTKK